MKEITFIRTYIEQWTEAEKALKRQDDYAPDKLADLYTGLTSNLSFAQTHYPQSRVTLYLNHLTSALHNSIYCYKHEKRSRWLTFWTQEIPLTIWQERRLLQLSLVLFIIFAFMGVVSQIADPQFARSILGDDYVAMTLDNIAKGQPVAVYGSMFEMDSFIGIMANNIFVSATMFASGIMTSWATAFRLFNNSLMVGVFLTFFYQHHLLWTASLAIFLHGTLELSALVISAAAGFAVGNSWLFPGTYNRMEALKRGAKRGLKICVSTVPLLIVAAFIEGFLSRHAEKSDTWHLIIILLSAAFIVFYYIILPYKTHLHD